MGTRRGKVQQGQKLVDYSLHVRAEYWDRLNVLSSALSRPCLALLTVGPILSDF